MPSSCPVCASTDWIVDGFSGGAHSAVEMRECQGCGHEWAEVLQA